MIKRVGTSIPEKVHSPDRWLFCPKCRKKLLKITRSGTSEIEIKCRCCGELVRSFI